MGGERKERRRKKRRERDGIRPSLDGNEIDMHYIKHICMHIHFHKIKMSLTRYFEKNALSNSIGKQVINLLHTDYAIDWDLICSAMLY